jgi:hypothetical protein
MLSLRLCIIMIGHLTPGRMTFFLGTWLSQSILPNQTNLYRFSTNLIRLPFQVTTIRKKYAGLLFYDNKWSDSKRFDSITSRRRPDSIRQHAFLPVCQPPCEINLIPFMQIKSSIGITQPRLCVVQVISRAKCDFFAMNLANDNIVCCHGKALVVTFTLYCQHQFGC